MAIADFPTPTDDSGDGESGTPVDLAWVDELEAAIEAVVTGVDNPNTTASTIIDEVIEARGSEDTLAENIEGLTQGEDNPDVQAPAIIDEVIAARGGEVDLDARFDAIDDQLISASLTETGFVDTSAQEFNGAKTFDDLVTMDSGFVSSARSTSRVGTSSATQATVGGQFYSDVVEHAVASSQTDSVMTNTTIPANALSENGDVINLRFGGSTVTGAGTNQRLVELLIGSTQIATYDATQASQVWQVNVDIIRIDSDSVDVVVNAHRLNTQDGASVTRVNSLDFTAAITLKTQATTGATNSTITQTYFVARSG